MKIFTILPLAAAMAISLGVTPNSADACGHCDNITLGHNFDPYNLDEEYQCDGHGGCHLVSAAGTCGTHRSCLLEEDAEQFAAAVRGGDSDAVRYRLHRLAPEQIKVVPERNLLLVKGCDGEFLSGFDLDLHDLADALAEHPGLRTE